MALRRRPTAGGAAEHVQREQTPGLVGRRLRAEFRVRHHRTDPSRTLYKSTFVIGDGTVLTRTLDRALSPKSPGARSRRGSSPVFGTGRVGSGRGSDSVRLSSCPDAVFEAFWGDANRLTEKNTFPFKHKCGPTPPQRRAGGVRWKGGRAKTFFGFVLVVHDTRRIHLGARRIRVQPSDTRSDPRPNGGSTSCRPPPTLALRHEV